jgi:hypothetical protein
MTAWGGYLATLPEPEADAVLRAVANAKPDGPPPEGGGDDHDGGRLATTCLAGIRPEPIRWHVPGYLPLGKLVILAGEGGYGKTTMTLDLTANTSRGWSCFGLSYEPPPPADVLVVSCEDDFGDTVVPRLLSAGADLNRVHRVDGVAQEDGRPRAFTLAELESLEGELKRRPDVRLVIIDPVGGYVGRAGVDDNREAELRGILDPLAELAARRSALVLMVKHLSKDQTRKAAQRVGGSAAYVNASRAAFLVAPDPEDPARRLFLPIKFNCGEWPSGLAFRMGPLAPEEQAEILAGMGHLGPEDRDRMAKQLYRVGWEGPVSVSADEALGADARAPRAGKTDPDRAAEWLRDRLAAGPVGSRQCAAEGDRAMGRTWPPPGADPGKAEFARVKWWRESVLKPRLKGRSQKLGKDGPWFFNLPDGPWPPSTDAIIAARAAEDDAAGGESEESEESIPGEPAGLGFFPEGSEGSEGSAPGEMDSSETAREQPRKNPPPPRAPGPDSSDPSDSSTGGTVPGPGPSDMREQGEAA